MSRRGVVLSPDLVRKWDALGTNLSLFELFQTSCTFIFFRNRLCTGYLPLAQAPSDP